MLLPVILIFLTLLFIILLLSFRIFVELIAKNSGITYTIKATIFKYIKVVEVKSGQKSKQKKPKRGAEVSKKKWETSAKENKAIHERVINIISVVLKENRGKVFHIEELSLSGLFSIEDAAVDAILYGIFLALWQFLIIFLSANFRVEHQSYKFYPDFQNNKNELIFHGILRVVLIKVLLLVVENNIHTKLKKFRKKTE